MKSGAVVAATRVNAFMPATPAFAPAEFPVTSWGDSSRRHAGFGARTSTLPFALTMSSGKE